SHLNFDTINHLAKQGLVKGLPILKYTNDYLCSTCQNGKNEKEPHLPKPEPSTNKKLQMLHMDLTNDEAADIIIKILKQALSLNVTVRYLCTDNDIEFINHTLRKCTDEVEITPHTSAARTPQQNGVVERRNHTLVEATNTMLIFFKSSLFLWAKAVAIACYTQNRSLSHPRYNKTPYELLGDRKP
nr:hypothetical protein [Tanacetum cinerariifolium]